MDPTPNSRHAIVSLDLVRWSAAFIVLLVHVRGANWVEFGLLPSAQRSALVALFFAVSRLGNEAVMIFFVLSGYLVGGPLIERVRAGRFDGARYAVDRITRILPPLLPACLLTAAITLAITGRPPVTSAILANMVGLNTILAPTLAYDSPLWSLAFEIWFYVIGGALAHLLSRGPRLGNLLLISLSILIFSKLNAVFLLYWAFGALMVLVRPAHGARALALVGLAIAGAGAYSYESGIASRSIAIAHAIPVGAAQALVCMGFSLTLPYLVSSAVNDRLQRWAPVAAALSAFSYSLYLIHDPINNFISAFSVKNTSITVMSAEMFLLRLTICLTFAAAFYFTFERRTSALRRWLIARLGESPRAADTPAAIGGGP